MSWGIATPVSPPTTINLLPTKIMSQNNIYKMTEIEHQQNPPSFGGNWEYGSVTRVCMSRSPKVATAMSGNITVRYEGVDGVPIMRERVLTKGGREIWRKYD